MNPRPTVALFVVLWSVVAVGGLSVTPAMAMDGTTVASTKCESDAPTSVTRHLEQYGNDCESDDLRGVFPFPATETVDRVGDPPWVPL